MIDTPGLNSREELLKHAAFFIHALTYREINTIFVVLKYDENIDKIIDAYDDTIRPLVIKNYCHKIIIIISKFD